MLWKGSLSVLWRSPLSILRWLGAFGVGAIVAPTSVFAQSALDDGSIDATAAAAGIDASTDIFAIIGNLINIFFSVLGVLLLLYILYAGYLWMTAGGEQEQVEKAKSYIKNAVIGLLIMVSSFAISRFVLNLLAGEGSGIGGGSSQVAGGPRAPGSGFPGSAGALGAGLIDYHIPERDARAVPRNASIMIAFKQPIDPASALVGWTDQTSSTARDVSADAIRVFQTGQEQGTTMRPQDFEGFVSPDKQVLILRPKALLGNPTRSSDYTVRLAAGQRGMRLWSDSGTGPSIFSGIDGRLSSEGGYSWRFEVSTVVDNTPPRVTSVVPVESGQYAPNIVVQVHFDKPLNPLSASGLVREGAGFQNIEVSATPLTGTGSSRPNGLFTLSNQFRTVEFVTNVSCGINSCGRQVYCLPFSSTIAVRVKAATLSEVPPQARVIQSGGVTLFDGIVDYTGNSLDGNANGVAQGPGQDDYSWRFRTDARPNLAPPKVSRVSPEIRASNVPLDAAVYGDFDSALQSSTISSDSVLLKTNEPEELRDTFWWSAALRPLRQDGGLAAPGDRVTRSRIDVLHRPLLPVQQVPAGTISPEYAPFFTSSVQNIYQNCFNPASSDQCTGSPFCCDGQPSSQACAIPGTLRTVPRS